MTIKVLMENTFKSKEYQSEHGLSLLVKTGRHKILFDTGASSKFIENASIMKEELKDVDIVIISHGHYDHGGGLEDFLEINQTAKVYIHNQAFGDFYSLKDSGKMRYIGLNKELKKSDRIELVDGYKMIDAEIELFSDVKNIEPIPTGNKSLFAKRQGEINFDDFRHEQNMILNYQGKSLLFSGCAHKGIINIITAFKKIKQASPYAVFGGFHLYKTREESLIKAIGKKLKDEKSVYYTGHCTGDKAYYILKEILKDKLNKLTTGLKVKMDGGTISSKENSTEKVKASSTGKVKKATELFREGYNCAQSIVGAFRQEADIEFKEAMKLGSSFGGGMGGLREVCGAVTGMFMVAGLRYGYSEKDDYPKKSKHYELISQLAKQFKDEHETIICRELLRHNKITSTPQRRGEIYYKERPCEKLVATAAEIINNLIKMEEKK